VVADISDQQLRAQMLSKIVAASPWALLAREQDGALEFASSAILRPPSLARPEWAEKFAAMSIEKPTLKGLQRGNRTQWLKPEIRVRAQHLKARGNSQACHCQGAAG
jgi:hypothetical protein